MASSALKALVDCAQAVQDGNLKHADSLLERILNLADEEPDKKQRDVVKYFAEALVRRAYGLHDPSVTYLTSQLTPPLNYLKDCNDAINNTVMGKKRLHLIDFYIPHLFTETYLFDGLPNTLSIRVSVILPPFLEKFINVQQEKDYLTDEAYRRDVELEELKVIYANSLGEVDASMLEFRRTEDEVVVVYYIHKLQTLLAEAGAMEREFSKLRQINPDIVIMMEQDVNYNDSNFIERLEESFQYYSHTFSCQELKPVYEIKNCCRRQISNIVGCEGKDRIVRPQTLAQWRSRLLTAGFLPVPLEMLPHFSEMIQENNGCWVITHNNRSMYFISAWKLRDWEHHSNPISNNFVQPIGFNPIPPSEDTVQPLQLFPEGFSLNRLAVLAEIYDMVEEVCCKYDLQFALTWACGADSKRTSTKIMSDPYKKHTLSIEIESSYCFGCDYYFLKIMEERSSKHYLLEELPVVEKLLESNKPFLFENVNPHIRSTLDPHAVVATSLQNHYNDDVYVVEFALPLSEGELEKLQRLALDIFNDLKKMKKMFVKLRVQGTEVGFQGEAISNIPQGTMPMRNPPPTLSTNYFLNSNTKSPSNTVEPMHGHNVLEIQGLNVQGGVNPNFHPLVPMHDSSPAGTGLFIASTQMSYNGVLETPRPHEQGGVIPNFHPPLPMHASSSTGIGLVTASNPIIYNGVLETPKPHEQGSGKQTSFEPLASNENEMVKADASNLRISSAKRRKLTSNVWEEFTKKKDEDGKEWATCGYCDRKFDGSSKKGTTHLRKHLESCKIKADKVRDKQQIFPVGRSDSKNDSVGEGNSSFDQERSSMDVARMIIKHQYPLNIVEHEFFGILLKNLQPMFKLQSQKALSYDIIRVYKEEKHKLLEYFGKLSCRFNLTISLWAHDLEKTMYCCYVVQFVDDNWELKKKILALKSFRHEFDTKIFHENFKSVLVDWNFDKKVCSLTIHSSSSSFEIAEEIRKSWPSFETSHPLSTFYINSDECIHGFLGKDNAGEKDFNMLRDAGKTTDGVIGTSNPCLVAIHDIYKRLSQHERRGYPLMNVKSDDNNWRTSSLVLALAAILDPRFKFELVEFSYNTIYGNHVARVHLTVIRNGLTDIFNEYASHMNNGTSLFDDTNSLTLLNAEENTIESFHRWYNSKSKVNIEASWKSELDKYLQEPIVSSTMEFDLLDWWSKQASSFPILGRMARDILAIPMSSIISGSTFSEKVMIDNPIFNGLDPEIIEAMICSRDWLESPKDCCPIVKSKNNSSLAHHLELEHFSSESDNEAPWNEDSGREATTWTEKEVRTYLVSPFTEKELKCLSKWQNHAINGEYVGRDEIQINALAPLLMIPPLRDARNYYIDDRVVNQFFVLLKRRYERFPHKYLKHHSFDSSTATFLIKGSKTESQVLNRVKQEDLKDVSKLFLPMCLHEHWLLFYADIDGKKLVWLDSIEQSQTSNEFEKDVIQHWFLEFLLPSLGHDHKDWSFHVPKDIPLQKNSVDCALFVMKYADCLTHGNYFPFTQDDMPRFRHRTFLDLYRGSIRLGKGQNY